MVKENSNFNIIIPDEIETSPKPPEQHLKILRQEIDPARLEALPEASLCLSCKAAERFDKFLKPWLSEKDVGKMSATGEDLDTRLEGFEPTTLGSEDRCSIR